MRGIAEKCDVVWSYIEESRVSGLTYSGGRLKMDKSG